MLYRSDKYGNKLSILGYGCMRFKQSNGHIDLPKAEKEILEAYNSGVNYFDTAYVYPGSESALGEILWRNNIRDKVNIASKLPHYLIKNYESLDRYFNEELKRLKSDHIDYYLMHMLTDLETWNRLKSYGIEEWIAEKKEKGQIRQIGFSYHGNSDMFKQLIDAYDWDFCQIQYNYLDENSQAGVTGLKYANQKGLPVIIMEPLRGGKLVNISEKAKKIMAKNPKGYSPASWALRWLWNQKEVTVVLSGMNSLEMVKENVASACQGYENQLNAQDKKMFAEVVKEINAKMKVGCTGCRYCMPCPKGVDIPGTFSAYNQVYSESFLSGQKEYIMCTALRKNSSAASNCVNCGLCKKHCPQHIDIPNELKRARKVIETPIYWLIRKAILLFRAY